MTSPLSLRTLAAHDHNNFLVKYLNHIGYIEKMNRLKSMRIYIARQYQNYRIYYDGPTRAIAHANSLFPGTPLNLSRCHLHPDLYPVKDWLRLHTEYTTESATFLHLKNAFTIVLSAEEADICYGYCEEEYESRPDFFKQATSFMVPRNGTDSIFKCKTMSFGIEDWPSGGVTPECQVTMPYTTGIYSPNATALAPWDLRLKRENLLCFYGGIWRGGDMTRRRETIEEMEAYSDLHINHSPLHFSTYFKAPLKMTSVETKETYVDAFFAEAWGNYAHSIFSWQPAGDSPTRRAFYDSWLFGCIPVISEHSFKMYNSLFKGVIFNRDSVLLEDIIVVLPHEVSINGTAVLEYLSRISVDEIKHRHSKLRTIAPLMQWGWETKDHIDPLLLMFAIHLK